MTFCVVVAVSSFAATFVVDANLSLRLPYVADLAEDYAARTGPVFVALGSSRTEDGIEINRLTQHLQKSMPDRRMTAFTAAQRATGLPAQEAMLNALLSAGPKPEVVMIEVGPEFLHAGREWIDVRRDLTWGNLLEFGSEAFQKYGARLAESRLLPLYSRRFEVRRQAWRWIYASVGRKPPKLDELEPNVPVLIDEPVYTPATPLKLTEAEREERRRKAPKPLQEFLLSRSASRSLERMLTKCRDRGIPVVLMDVPGSRYYRESQETSERGYSEFISAFVARHQHVRLFNARDMLPDEAFYDNLHANTYGQELLCRRLAQTEAPAALAYSQQAGGGERVLKIGMKQSTAGSTGK